MDKDSQMLDKFEEILRNGESNTYFNLYISDSNSDRPLNNINPSVSAKDILASVDNEIKALQGADCLNSDRSASKNIEMDRKSSLLPIDMLPQYEQLQQRTTSSANKFETQCVSDTQLVNLIQDAEAIEAHQGMTQEFESSFCDVTDNDCNMELGNGRNNDDDHTKQHSHSNIEPGESSHVNVQDSKHTHRETTNYLYHRNDYDMELEKTDNLSSESKHRISVKSGPVILENRHLTKSGESDEGNSVIIESKNKSDGQTILKNSGNIEENEEILDSASVIIVNEPLDLENISQNYEVFSIPVTIEIGENSNQFANFETGRGNLENVAKINGENSETIVKNNSEAQLFDEDIFDGNTVQNSAEGVPIVDISLKDPDPNIVIHNIDTLETAFAVNDNVMGQCDNYEEVIEGFKDIENPSSPVFDVNSGHKRTDLQNSPEHLVVDLKTFEAFEKVAFQALEKNSDKETAKFLIDSQILGKELRISEPVLNEPETQNNETINGPCETHDTGKNERPSERKAMNVTQEVIRDEILFSSDEEEELLHKKIETTTCSEDLPLTFALETSFYDQPDILDKTMYVGFQTANNKSIQICTDSFHKAQSVFNNIEKQISGRDLSLSELVKNYDAESNVGPNICDNESIEKTSFLENNKNNNCEDKNVTVEDPKQTEENDWPQSQILPSRSQSKSKPTLGFKTASNKNIKLTDLALEKAMKVFEDIAVFESERNIQQKIENIRNKITNTIISDIDENLQRNSDTNSIIDTKNTRTKFEEENSFDTAEDVTNSGKDSEEILFTDFNIDDISLLKDNVFDDCDFEEKMDEKPENSKQNSNEKCFNNVDLAMGFKTASNKCIQISEQAFAKTRNIFSDIVPLDFPNKNICEGQTKINLTNNTLNQNEHRKQTVIGFKTASNKAVEISDKALAKTKNIFEGIDLTEITKTIVSMPTTDNDKAYQPDKSAKCFDNVPKEIVCFKTASNKNFEISSEAMSKTKNLFQDIYKDCNEESKTEVLNCNKAKFEVKLAVSVQNEKESEIFDKNSEVKDTIPSFSGYKTASNKISSETLSRTNRIFNDLIFGENICENDEGKSGQVIVGFQTASCKPVKISEAALAKSRQLFKDIDEGKTDSNQNNLYGLQTCSKILPKTKQPNDDVKISPKIITSTKFQGFETASHKDVQILEEASKSRKIFQDLDNQMHIPRPPDKSSPKFEGFKTASHKKVQISEKALAKSRKLFQDLDNSMPILDPLENNNLKFQGFMTASQKEVPISEIALEKCRKLFQDIEKYAPANSVLNSHSKKSPFMGFKTASCKDVQVSKEALAVSKKLFQDLDSEIRIPDLLDISSQKFQGFKTANLKEVQISETALAKSRKLFQDLDTNISDPFDKTPRLNSPKFLGFETASHKEVKISEKALSRSKKLFEDLDDVMNPAKLELPGSRLQGFQTASKQKVAISPRALSRGRKILAALDTKTNKPDVKPKHNFGFQTASNKQVIISDAALAKSRKLFEDIVDQQRNDNNDIEALSTYSIKNNEQIASTFKTNNSDKQKASCNFLGFQTANNEQVKVSEEALAKSKKIFNDLEHKLNKNIERTDKAQETAEVNLENLIDSQVLNQFEESMHTEDFKETTPVKSKRSGSPILSCPKPKRRKFEIPYSQKVKVKKDTTYVDTDILKNSNKLTKPDKIANIIINFNANYKQSKILTLKDLDKLENNSTDPKPEIDPYITGFNFNNLLNFEFTDKRNDLTEKKLSIEEIKNLFLDSVNKKFLPDGWIENHLKLIIWKLLSYEVKFPKTMSQICTAKNVIDQLKYRYDKELYNAERPALRKILEKDDVASKTLVLCVADIIQEEVCNDGSKPPSTDLLLTDGWYTIRANIDAMLTGLVVAGKIAVGSKIVTSGAELVACDQGVAPWEDTSSIRLKISGNSTRRARWFTRLGYHSGCVAARLRCVHAGGGAVARLTALVTRVYPPLYVEKFPDGSTVTRSERLEIQYQTRHEAERQSMLEKLYEEVEKELSDQDSQDSDGGESSAKKRCLESGSQIAKAMKRNKDPSEFRFSLTESQRNLLQAHTVKQREKYLQAIQDKIQEKIAKCGLNVNRNVVTLLKVRVVGIEEAQDVVVTRGMLSIWKPNEELMEVIKEGAWIEIRNVLPTAVRNSEIQLSAGRQTLFLKSKFKETERIQPFTRSMIRTCYPIKELTKNPAMTTEYNEIDTVGMIFLIDPPMKTFDSNKFQFQNVYFADADKNIISINFWGGLKKYGVENILQTAQIISCSNLQKRAGNTRKSIPQYRATEFSYFTKTPKFENARKLIDELHKKMLNIDKDKFCEDCVNLKNNFAVIKPYGNTDVSPYRFQDVNLSKNKIFIDSPLTRKNDDNFNLTGLDFESTFKQSETQDMSPKLLLRKRQINEKIAKLRMYGDPPPLSPIQILNKSANARKAFKSPLLSKSSDADIDKQIAREKISVDTPEHTVASGNKKFSNNITENKNEQQIIKNEELQCSPVLDRTYVKKNMNPVRLNFSKSVAIDENDISDVIDQFGEDFDGSPPLSLD